MWFKVEGAYCEAHVCTTQNEEKLWLFQILLEGSLTSLVASVILLYRQFSRLSQEVGDYCRNQLPRSFSF